MDFISILFSVITSIIISFYFTIFQFVMTDYKDFFRCIYLLNEIRSGIEDAKDFDKWEKEEKEDSHLRPEGHMRDIGLKELNSLINKNTKKIMNETSILELKPEKRLRDLALDITGFIFNINSYKDINSLNEKELEYLNHEADALIKKYFAYKYDIWKITVMEVLKSKLTLIIYVIIIAIMLRRMVLIVS